jgi:D-alanine-D-alanine ligase
MNREKNPYGSKKVGVLMGGISAEREISLSTGASVHRALAERGYETVAIDWTEDADLGALLRAERIEVVWNALHGTYGEDGCVQGFLESLRIPYTGSGVAASAMGMEKVASKKIFERDGVPTPPWRIASSPGAAIDAARQLRYPVVVKPSREGSTVGVSIVREEGEIARAWEEASGRHGVVMLERYVPGRELSVGILDGEVLGTVEIRARSGFYDYEAKYQSGDTEYIVPAPVDEATDESVRKAGLAAYLSLGCEAHSRTDMRVTEEGDVRVLEVNTLPGMTDRSLLPKTARLAGLDYGDLVERILASARLRA